VSSRSSTIEKCDGRGASADASLRERAGDAYFSKAQVLSTIPRGGDGEGEAVRRRAPSCSRQAPRRRTPDGHAPRSSRTGTGIRGPNSTSAIAIQGSRWILHRHHSCMPSSSSRPGRITWAIEQDRLAMDLDPLSPHRNWNATSTFSWRGGTMKRSPRRAHDADRSHFSVAPELRWPGLRATGRLERDSRSSTSAFSLPGVPAPPQNRAMCTPLIGE